MNRNSSGRWVGGVFFCLLGAAPLANAAIYKCGVGGTVVYQDMPCAGKDVAPMHVDESSAAPTIRDGRAGSARLASLYLDIRGAEKEYKALQNQMQAEADSLNVSLKGTADVQAAKRTVVEFRRQWQARMSAASERSEQLVAELRALCPNGAILSERQQSCR